MGRVLLVHPPDAESSLTARALGFRLWPQLGAIARRALRTAFQQAIDLGYEGSVVIGLNVPDLGATRITEAVGMLEEHQGVVIGDGDGGIALLALQEPQPTLFARRARAHLRRAVHACVTAARAPRRAASRTTRSPATRSARSRRRPPSEPVA